MCSSGTESVFSKSTRVVVMVAVIGQERGNVSQNYEPSVLRGGAPWLLSTCKE